MVWHLLSFVFLFSVAYSSESRTGRVWPFKIVSFPNDPCTGATRNGTCYTQEECENKGGSPSGSCAQGFGVCCIIRLQCGEESRENCTYLEQDVSSFNQQTCNYRICPCGDGVCRIKFEFEKFKINGPHQGTADNAEKFDANGVSQGPGARPDPNGHAIGDCVRDSFSIASSGGMGTPIICGDNTGQHMWIDTGSGCSEAVFRVSNEGDLQRSWRIKVTQYDCGLDEIAGPPGCLQYMTSNTGVIESFNFPDTSTVGASTTHLSNQNYDICFHRPSDKCSICYYPSIYQTAPQLSFGLSGSSADDVLAAQVNQNCNSDYIVIPHSVNTVIASMTPDVHDSHRICGRRFCTLQGCTASVTICSGQTPFRMGFHTDGGEVTTGDTNTATNELDRYPGGIIGFKLNYFLVDC